ncbi:MAG: type II secretion system F family protein [Alphaproteobacteria bacterium]
MKAPSRKAVFQELESKQHHLLSCKTKWSFHLSSPVKVRDLVAFFVQMHHMDKAGVPLLEALQDARDLQTNKAFKQVLATIFQDVKAGKLLSDSMAPHRKIFRQESITIIKVAEQAGTLHKGFERLAQHFAWVEDNQSAITKAIRYPLILMAVIVGVITMLMTHLVPQLTSFIQAYGDPSPMTMTLISVSEFIATWGIWIFCSVPVSVIFCLIMRKFSKQFSYAVDALVLKVPVLGALAKSMAISRYIHQFSMLLSSGLDIIDCLNFAGNTTENSFLKKHYNAVTAQVLDGSTLSEAFANHKVFPQSLIRMVKVGEVTGSLDTLLEHVYTLFEKSQKDRVQQLIGMLEPALVITAGAMMIWIILAVFYPMYEQIAVIG